MSFNVLVVSPLPPPQGGIATWSTIVLSEIALFPDIKSYHFNTALTWRSMNDKRLFVRLIGGSLQAIKNLLLISKNIIRNKIDVVHLCTSGSLSLVRDILLAIFCKIFRIKIIVHCHYGRIPYIFANSFLEKFLNIALFKISNMVVVIDEETFAALQFHVKNSKLTILANPIDLDLFVKDKALHPKHINFLSGMRIVFVGHVIPEKGVEELISACARIDCVDITIDFVGCVLPSYKSRLIEMSSCSSRKLIINFFGSVAHSDVADFIIKSDVFVLPSQSEAFPYVILEAMALSKPIIATRVGAIPSMLDENSLNPCGLIVDPNSISQLESAIKFCFYNPNTLNGMANAANEKVRSFYTKTHIVKSLANLWREIL